MTRKEKDPVISFKRERIRNVSKESATNIALDTVERGTQLLLTIGKTVLVT